MSAHKRMHSSTQVLLRGSRTLDDTAPTTLLSRQGRLIPFNSSSPTASTVTAFSTFVSTRGLISIALAWPHRKGERQR